ncbi:hypothetical protein KC644_01740 [Candidatus Berkelbacteria bacterium]|nr:hypothetical protein [Candidatus Berkelbacteria bacterium]
MFSPIKKLLAATLILLLTFGGLNYSRQAFAQDRADLLDDNEAFIIDLTNQARNELGIKDLTYNLKLQQAAEAKARDMIDNDYFDHVSPTGTSPWYFIHNANYSYQSAGENLAIDFTDQKNAVKAWLKSPSHRANIIDSGYTEIGLAIVEGDVKGFKTTVVVQMFGEPLKSKLFAKHFTND